MIIKKCHKTCIIAASLGHIDFVLKKTIGIIFLEMCLLIDWFQHTTMLFVHTYSFKTLFIRAVTKTEKMNILFEREP